MKTLNEYMVMSYHMEIMEDQDEGGYVVSFPDLPGCLTCGETVEQAMENAVDEKRAWLTAALEDGRENLNSKSTRRNASSKGVSAVLF